MSTMYGELLRMAYAQSRASHPAPLSPHAAAAHLASVRVRLAHLSALEDEDPVVSETADVLAYDLALIDACESLGINHGLIDHAGPAARSRAEQALNQAGYDPRLFLPGGDGRGRALV